MEKTRYPSHDQSLGLIRRVMSKDKHKVITIIYNNYNDEQPFNRNTQNHSPNNQPFNRGPPNNHQGSQNNNRNIQNLSLIHI